MAIANSPIYDGQMGRERENVSVRAMLLRAVAPSTIEYLLNGARYILRNNNGRSHRLPVGATTNEALDTRGGRLDFGGMYSPPIL